MTFEEYIEELSRQHPAIKHEENGECHFSALADDTQSRLARTMKFPCVTVDTGDFDFSGQIGNVSISTASSIMFLNHVRDTGSSKEVLAAFKSMKSICLDFIKKMCRDKKKPEFRQVLARFTLIGSEGHRVYFKDAGLYGYVLFINTDEPFSDADCEHVFND